MKRQINKKEFLSEDKITKTSNNKRFCLLTYNVFLRPAGINTYEDDYKDQRLLDILKQIRKFDIVCFQELFKFSSFRAEKMICEAINHGFHYWKVGDAPSFWKGPTVDSGLMILSKYPIVASCFKSFNVGILSDGSADKGIIYCKVKISNSIMHLFNFHLQASYVGHKYDKFCIITRLAQIKVLRDYIKQKLAQQNWNDTELVLMACDLNIDANKPDIMLKNEKQYEKFGLDQNFNEYEHFIQYFREEQIRLIDLALEKYTKHPCTFGGEEKILTCQSQQNTFQRLDYIFQVKISKRNRSILQPIVQSIKVQQFCQQCQTKLYTQLSDHYGLSVALTNQENI